MNEKEQLVVLVWLRKVAAETVAMVDALLDVRAEAEKDGGERKRTLTFGG